MKTTGNLILKSLILLTIIFSITQITKAQENPGKVSILIHLTQGPENPTVAALAFLVAKTAVDEGHSVTMFLAGDAVQVMRENVIENLQGLGTGFLKEHLKTLTDAGCTFYLSGMSSKSRGLSAEDIPVKNIEFSSPSLLLKLSLEHDKIFVY